DVVLQLGAKLGERRAGLGVGAIPNRRLDERDEGLEGRLLRRDLAERNAGARPRVRILPVPADERLGEQRDVLDRAREQADMVERSRQLQRPGARDEAVSGLEAVDAAISRRPDRRAV